MRKFFVLTALFLTATAAAQVTAPLPPCVTLTVQAMPAGVQLVPKAYSARVDRNGIPHNHYGAWVDLVFNGKSSPVTTSGLRDWTGEPIKGLYLPEGGLSLKRIPGVQVQEKLAEWTWVDGRARYHEFWVTCAVL